MKINFRTSWSSIELIPLGMDFWGDRSLERERVFCVMGIIHDSTYMMSQTNNIRLF